MTLSVSMATAETSHQSGKSHIMPPKVPGGCNVFKAYSHQICINPNFEIDVSLCEMVIKKKQKGMICKFVKLKKKAVKASGTKRKSSFVAD